VNRREFLAATASLLASSARAGASTTRFILLGTAGGPRPKIDRAATSQVLLAGDRAYVIDDGRIVHAGPAAELEANPALKHRLLAV